MGRKLPVGGETGITTNMSTPVNYATIAVAGETVKTSLRRVLDDSHVAPIAIALLLARSLFEVIGGLAPPIGYSILGAIWFLILTVTEREFPLISPGLSGPDLLILSESISHLARAAEYAFAAWLLSRWVYGQGPLRSLLVAWSKRRRSNASSFEGGTSR
jgi:hypothetical protein